MDPAGVSLGTLALPRTIVDIVAARIALTFGGQRFLLPVRSIAANRRWKEGLDIGLLAVLSGVESMDDPGRLMEALVTGGQQFLEAVYAYDALPVREREDGLGAGVLPERETLEELANPLDPVIAVATIWRAANPLADMTVALMNQSPVEGTSPEPTNGPRPNTAGRRRRSRKN